MNESINTRISKEKMRLLNRNLKVRGIRNLEKTLILELDTTKTNNIKRVVNWNNYKLQTFFKFNNRKCTLNHIIKIIIEGWRVSNKEVDKIGFNNQTKGTREIDLNLTVVLLMKIFKMLFKMFKMTKMTIITIITSELGRPMLEGLMLLDSI